MARCGAVRLCGMRHPVVAGLLSRAAGHWAVRWLRIPNPMYSLRRISLSRLLVAALSGVLLYFLLYPRVHHYTFSYTLRQSSPKAVWEYVADFSNMPKLNPTILHWELVSESGNYGHWRYSVRYTEHLSGLPLIRNYATAHYQVKPAQEAGGHFLILSSHNTCFYTDMLCHGGEGTTCSETIHYACPWVFGSFCLREVAFQRETIRENLKAELLSSVQR